MGTNNIPNLSIPIQNIASPPNHALPKEDLKESSLTYCSNSGLSSGILNDFGMKLSPDTAKLILFVMWPPPGK